MNHSFDTKLAEKYGIESAILLENIAFWTKKNIANNKNFYEGYYWVYNSVSAFNELFPYINPQKIRRCLLELEENKILLVGNFNKMKYDKTKWYSIINEEVLDIYNITASNDDTENDNVTEENMQTTVQETRSKKANIILDEIESLEVSIELKEKIKEFYVFRKAIKKPIKTILSIKKMISDKKFKDEKHLLVSIDNSIANGYQGVFPTKDYIELKPVIKSNASSLNLSEWKIKN